jgi:hypothetical protein
MKNSFVLKIEVDHDVRVAVRQRNDFWKKSPKFCPVKPNPD